jgi:hypothetical protein
MELLPHDRCEFIRPVEKEMIRENPDNHWIIEVHRTW